ncbi:MAG: SRPBCC family protein [Acidobacteriota bacterium]
MTTFIRLPASLLLVLLGAAAAVPAPGEVSDVADNGFTFRSAITVSVPPARAYAAMVDVGKWWGPDHTFSGDAANLSIEARPQGCWCERLPGGGGVRHLNVTFASPGKQIRFEGGLGPLQSMAVTGSMSWKFDPAEKGTTVEVRYAVGGYNPGGFKELAAAVDGVLRAQIERYKRYVETGKP